MTDSRTIRSLFQSRNSSNLAPFPIQSRIIGRLRNPRPNSGAARALFDTTAYTSWSHTARLPPRPFPAIPHRMEGKRAARITAAFLGLSSSCCESGAHKPPCRMPYLLVGAAAIQSRSLLVRITTLPALRRYGTTPPWLRGLLKHGWPRSPRETMRVPIGIVVGSTARTNARMHTLSHPRAWPRFIRRLCCG